MILFCDNIVPLFLSRMRNAQPNSGNQITNAMAFASTVLDLALCCAKLVCFCYKFIFIA